MMKYLIIKLFLKNKKLIQLNHIIVYIKVMKKSNKNTKSQIILSELKNGL